MSIPDRICAYADDLLDGSNLTFALVIWIKGRPGDPDAIAISAPPATQAEAYTALATAAALTPQPTGEGT